MSTNLFSTVILHFGYVESTKLACVICGTDETFPSAEAAIKDLAEELLAKYKSRFVEFVESSKKCCVKARKDNGNIYCNKCGHKLHVPFDVSAFRDWIYNIPNLDLDSFGYDEVCGKREMIWEVGDSPNMLFNLKEDNVAVVSWAEKDLLKVLGLEE